jgi:transcriptional regulator with XRE-family HTH domain
MTTPNESGQPKPRRRLAAARRRRGWGQVRAAIEINQLGLRLGYSEDELRVDAHALSRWERGVHEPKARYIRIMCSLYELSADQLDLAPCMAAIADAEGPSLSTSADAVLVPPVVSRLELVGDQSTVIAHGGNETERRDVLRYGLGTVVAIVTGSAADLLGGDFHQTKRVRIVDPLSVLRHTSLHDPTPARNPPSIEALQGRVVAARHAYQACQYAEMSRYLPCLLADIDLATQALSGVARQEVYALSAEAHHVTASVLLKHDDRGMAWIAADRSLQAAERSGDPRVIASSARIITHALMSSGHFTSAAEAASRMARQFSIAWGKPTADDLSVYGSLLLRGAVAAARQGDRGTTRELIDEAADTARRVGRDYSHRLTAFGLTNIEVHRVHVAVTQRDAGTALELSRAIDLNAVPLTERRVSLLVDTAIALWQCGRVEQTYHTLRSAEGMAPEEMAARPSVRRLVVELLVHAPKHLVPELKELAVRVGAAGVQG